MGCRAGTDSVALCRALAARILASRTIMEKHRQRQDRNSEPVTWIGDLGSRSDVSPRQHAVRHARFP